MHLSWYDRKIRVFEYQAIYDDNKIPSRHCFMVFDMNHLESKKPPHCYSKILFTIVKHEFYPFLHPIIKQMSTQNA